MAHNRPHPVGGGSKRQRATSAARRVSEAGLKKRYSDPIEALRDEIYFPGPVPNAKSSWRVFPPGRLLRLSLRSTKRAIQNEPFNREGATLTSYQLNNFGLCRLQVLASQFTGAEKFETAEKSASRKTNFGDYLFNQFAWNERSFDDYAAFGEKCKSFKLGSFELRPADRLLRDEQLW